MILKTALFEVPLYKTKVKKHVEINDWFLQNIYQTFLKNGVNEKSRNIYSSYFPNAPKLDKKIFDGFYQHEIKNFMLKAGFNTNHNWIVRTNYWYNIGLENSYQEVHDHLGGPVIINYAAIHFLKFNKNVHAGTVFYNPLEAVLKSTLPTTNEKIKPNDYQGLQKVVQVEQEDLIIFPAYLPHSVMTQNSTEERITIAFNLSIYEKQFDD